MKRINIIYKQSLEDCSPFDSEKCYCKAVFINWNISDLRSQFYNFGIKTKDDRGCVSQIIKYYIPVNNEFEVFEYMKDVEFANKKDEGCA